MRTQWTTSWAHQVVSSTRPDRLRNLRGREQCYLVGASVDAVTGRVLLLERELELTGVVPLVFERSYSSAWAHRRSVLGPGWSHSLDQAVWSERGRMVCRIGDGREIELDTRGLTDGVMHKGDRLRAPFDALVLVCVDNGRYTLEAPYGPTWCFERSSKSAGDRREGLARLVSIRHANGPKISLEYDAEGRLATARDTVERELRLTYDDRGLLIKVSVHGPGGQHQTVATYRYGPDGHLHEASDTLAHEIEYEVQGGVIVRRTDRCGRSVYFGYDDVGSGACCVRTWGDGGLRDRELRYRKGRYSTRVADSLGRKITIVSDIVHNVRAVKGVARFEYAETGEAMFLRSVVDPHGHETRLEHDERGDPVRVVEKDGAAWTTEFDTHHRPIRTIAPTGAEWTWGYNSAGQLAQMQDPLGIQTSFTHEAGRLVSVIRTGKGRAELTYDGLGSLSSVRLPDGREVRFEHDWLGRLTRVSEPDGRWLERSYDGLGRLTRERDDQGRTHLFDHDAEGNLTRYETASTSATWVYDERGLVASRTDESGTAKFVFDAEARLVDFTDVTGRTWHFERDALGRVVEELTFNGARWSYRYQGASTLVSTVLGPDKSRIDYDYDSKGRVTSIEHSDGRRESFAYGPLGGLVEACCEGSTVSLERDMVGRVVREHHGEDWVTSTWGRLGERRELRSSLGQRLAFSHGLHGLRSITIGTTIASDDVWRMYFTEETRGHLKIFWAHQQASRRELEAVEYDRDVYGVFGWLGRSRWRTRALANEARRHHEHGVKRDDAGRLVERVDREGGTWRYQYTVSGLLVSVVRPDGNIIDVRYDAFGRLFSQSSKQSERRWIWDGGSPLHEISTDYPPTMWLFEPKGPALFGKVQAGRHYSIDTARDTAELILCDEEERTCWCGALDEKGAAKVTCEETSWPWIEVGLYDDEATGLRFGRTDHFEPTTGSWLVPPLAGLVAEVDRSWSSETFVPHSMLLTHRVSAELLEAFVSALSAPSLPEATTPEALLGNTLPVPDEHPLLEMDPILTTPSLKSAATLWRASR